MIRGDVHMREAFQNYCPLGCSMLPDLYLKQQDAFEALKEHFKEVHKVTNSAWSLFLIDFDGKETKHF